MTGSDKRQERLHLLMDSFFRNHNFEEINWMLNSLYREWAVHGSAKVERGPKFKLLMCFDELKEFLEELHKLYGKDGLNRGLFL